MLERLSRPFPPQRVKTRQQAGQTLYYVSVDDVIDRLNEVLGNTWSSEVKECNVTQTGTDSKGRPLWTTWTKTAIIVRNDDGSTTSREGVGAATNFDIDNCVKASSSESLKKCAMNWGVSLELFKPARRAFVAQLRGWQSMEPELLRTQLSQAVSQWRNEDSTLSSFASKQEANRAFLEEACLTEDEQAEIRQRCMGPAQEVA